MINKKIFLLLSLATLLFATSCSDDDETIYGNWIDEGQFVGDKRAGAVSFVIDGTAYFGLGYNGSRDSESQYFFDFFSYDGGSWAEFDNFPGAGRQDAFAFAIDGKGYVGCGYYNDTAEIFYSDVWEFDPQAEAGSQWTPLPEFADGLQLTEMTSFVVGGKAYVTGGRFDSDLIKSDSYVFDPTTGTFTHDGYMRKKRAGACSFVIGDIAYVVGGYDNSYVGDMERFDATTGEWLAAGVLESMYLPSSTTDDYDHYDDALDIRRAFAVTFVVDGKGYVVSGNNGSILSTVWEYNPGNLLWTEKNSFEYYMYARQKACSFVLNDQPYVLTGQSGSGYLDDMAIFEPNIEEDEED